MLKKKMRVVVRVAAACAVIGGGYLVRQHSGAEDHVAWTVAGWALTALVLVRVAFALRRGRAALKAQGGQVSLKSIETATVSAMPQWAQGWSKSEMKIYGGFWRALRRVPLPDDDRFTVQAGARSAAYFAIAVLAILVCAGAGLVLLAGWSSSLKSLLIGVACIAGPALYLLVMLAGERRLLKEAGHSVDADAVRLALGLRFAADVSLADISSCVRLTGPASILACVVSPFEAPNVLLTLRAGAVVDAVRFGYPFRPGKAALALYVDDPDGFVDAVSAVTARQLPRYA